MAARTPVEILRDEARCSICLGIFQDPVSIHCGHSFCRSCITRTWEGLTTNFSCPQCRETKSHKTLRPNWELANMVEAAKNFNLTSVREEEGGENLCEVHQEPLKLFCQDDKRLICVVCDRSKVHRNHSVVPMGEAAQEYKVRGSWVSHEEILQRLLEETTSLGTLIEEVERMYQQPDWQLLKVRGVPSGSEGWEGREKALFPPKSAAMSLTLSPPPAQMTLDPETANARLRLSADCKLVRWECCEQDLPSNPRRFKFHPCVLGSRGFTSGWHCWEVEVLREGFWGMGVVKESVPRDHGFCLNPGEGVWALRHTDYGYKVLTSPDVTRLTLHSVPRRIRICLDYEEGWVVFFDAESNEQIFAFSPASFQGERVFPWGSGDGPSSPPLVPTCPCLGKQIRAG
uniref:Zinc finger protein RFP-like n=1 Tax=Calidris pygmaea TaxID=425635 RepID=A0A8C3JSA5_9CHAR